ncbi:threonine/homoserine efflux transporter RhtA [Mesobacillus foraminis]|uniref:Threonine/homoserine efflux transporter RhtA n=1 Tax=Mesobacillus foraminis TaxID=279826 RepID=A0A4R2B8R2_9BACI|nr:threonine/homoserine efflux transporter RhtA [Mesobacillus foraminis]
MPYLAIAFAALMWGLIGFFVKGLSSAGFSAMDIVTIRVTVAAIVLIGIGIIFYRSYLKINWSDLPLFMGTGLLSIVFFNWCYFTAMEKMNIPVAAALLYTSPAFVIVLSLLFLKEKLTVYKVIAVVGTITGCTLVAGVYSVQGSSFPVSSIMIGLGAGLGYALYSIFGKLALRKYHPFTLTIYTFVTASVFMLPVFFTGEKVQIGWSGDFYLYALGLGVVPTVLAYFAYSWGLGKVDSSTAAIIATIEPVAAAFLGVMAFGDTLNISQTLGIVLILLSVSAVNLPKRKRQLEG